MIIWVDADACPVLDIIINESRKASIELHIVKNINHHINTEYGIIHTVDTGSDQADFFIANRLLPDDLVITQDYGLAAMCIAKKAYVINQFGQLIDTHNIDLLLERRHFHREERKKHGRYTKFKKRTPENDAQFKATFLALIQKSHSTL